MVVAWLGAKVVSTHLAGYMITIHMMLALVLIMTIIAGIFSTYEPPAKLQVRNPGWLRGVALLGFLLVLMQIGLGTQLREAVDQVSNHLSAKDRSNWLAETGIIFKVHRSFSWTVLLAGTGFWALLYYKGIRSGPLFRAASLQVGLLLVAFSLGVILAKLALPAPAQPLHLWVASLLAGAQFVVVWGSFRWLGGANDTAADPASTESGYLPNPQASTPEQAQAQPEPQKTN
jgi:cytochrome c oxidase assembly protein subunit 15